MIEYTFTHVDIQKPDKGIQNLNDLANDGWRAVAWVPRDLKMCVFLERREVTVTDEEAKRCQGIKADGTPCGGWAIKNSSFCVSHQDQDVNG